ncbi:MAG: protein kinase [Acidobacteria bacterium]|nr:protein kinase [Acidobacteriota bacterium]
MALSSPPTPSAPCWHEYSKGLPLCALKGREAWHRLWSQQGSLLGMVGQTISHYRITAKLGEGGMGAVYRAEDEKLQRPVALKFLPPELAADAQARERLLREARAASRLSHPNIATIYEVGEAEGKPFIAMELVAGESLKQRLLRAALPPADLLEVARQIAEGLNEAHQAGVVHRDVKPANIMLDAKGRVKILDFGLAVFTGRERAPGETAESFMSRTATGWSTGGTVPYMSPEQLRGERTDARSDIFSLGALLYECLTGRLPFRGDTSIDILHAILRQPPTPLRSLIPEVSPEWEELVERCLEKEPERRFRSVREVQEALRRAAVPATVAEKSVAVLYFENLSGAKEDEYFRDGITEDVITELSKIKPLRVFPRSAVLTYQDQPATAPEIGRQLNAAYVLGGSLRRAGNRLRITAQLVETRTGHSVWAERYDREMKDVFEVQDEIARNISQALRIQLSPQEEKAIARKPTENSQAYDYYLRGRSYARRGTRSDLEFAVQMYERAIALDPDFAQAHAGLAIACGLYYEWHEQQPRWVEKGLASCERALTLDPQLPEALSAQARIFFIQRKFDETILSAQRAIERKPDCEGAYWALGNALFVSDRWDEAVAVAERAIEAGGDDYNMYIPFMMIFERVGQPEKARSLRQQQRGALERHLEWVPDDVRARILLANCYASLRNETEAVRELQRAVALRPNDANILYNAACTYGILQKKEDALALLRRAKENGWNNPAWAARDPDLACLHGDPEFERLVKG